ncbi:ABC transporter substrate-binding protein [Anthocerotibacter panamensis]|uniref:ABC transporter substrate-binding protein n=1 Tax=Anthocerotibacter panamensis TaxID=2857077 RepID=UPI001C4067D5|nr:sugar ABC transporter substrate-binding protein [Anthocerotibacter panamensis]
MVRRRHFLMGSAVFLGSCGANTTADRPLEFWTMQLKPEHTALLEATLAAFSRQHPEAGTVKWVDVPWADMEKKILSAVAAGTAPDVANLNPQFAVKLAQRQALLDLESQVSAPDKARYFPNFWRANALNGVTFGLPWYVSTQVTIYNRDLFKKAGLDRPPATYPQLRRDAQAIRAKTGKYAFLPTFDTGQILESWVKMGVTLLGPDHKAAFNSPEGLAAADYYVGLYRDGLIPRETLTEGHRKAVELYQAAESALLLTGPQFLQSISRNAPELAEITGVGPQISGPNKKTNAAAMNIVIPKATSRPEAALQLALFITNDQNQLALAKAGNLLPSTRKAARDPFFTTAGADAATEGRVVSARQLDTAEVLIPPFDNLDQLQQMVYEELQLAMLDKKSTAQCLKDAALRWDTLA